MYICILNVIIYVDGQLSPMKDLLLFTYNHVQTWLYNDYVQNKAK